MTNDKDQLSKDLQAGRVVTIPCCACDGKMTVSSRHSEYPPVHGSTEAGHVVRVYAKCACGTRCDTAGHGTIEAECYDEAVRHMRTTWLRGKQTRRAFND